MAMYRAKAAGRARYEMFDRAMHTDALARLRLETELRRAVERSEFRLHYQPLVSLSTGRITGLEALLRWEHPERGLIQPADFIPVAEETGLIVPIGEFVLDEACRRARDTHALRGEGSQLSMHVNLSAVELQHVDVLARVTETLRRHDLRPEQLVLEITESVLVDAQMSATLRELHESGVRLALDDFGTGYSSLSYLRSFPLDVLKIAKPFVDGIADGRDERSFVRLIIELSKNLGLEVVAEGIESAGQLEVLRELGCDLGQGFYLSPPLTATLEDSIAVVRTSRSPADAGDHGRYGSSELYDSGQTRREAGAQS